MGDRLHALPHAFHGFHGTGNWAAGLQRSGRGVLAYLMWLHQNGANLQVSWQGETSIDIFDFKQGGRGYLGLERHGQEHFLEGELSDSGVIVTKPLLAASHCCAAAWRWCRAIVEQLLLLRGGGVMVLQRG
jgi:hypothetical protein